MKVPAELQKITTEDGCVYVLARIQWSGFEANLTYILVAGPRAPQDVVLVIHDEAHAERVCGACGKTCDAGKACWWCGGAP